MQNSKEVQKYFTGSSKQAGKLEVRTGASVSSSNGVAGHHKTELPYAASANSKQHQQIEPRQSATQLAVTAIYSKQEQPERYMQTATLCQISLHGQHAVIV